MNLLLVTVLAAALQTEATAPPAEPDPKVSAFIGLGVLGALPGAGSALEGGVRIKLARHLAASFDLGYGVLGWTHGAQDRWWLTPSMAATFEVGPLQLDVGAGIGLGASSGYGSWSLYAAAPFDPDWAFQLVPEVRAYVSISLPVDPSVRAYARLEAASLVLGGNTLGFRAGNEAAGFADTTWLHFAVGAQFGFL